MTPTEFPTPHWKRFEAEDADASPFLPSGGRDAYLAWVAAWKTELAATVARIREAKGRRRDRALTDDERNGAASERQRLRVRAHNLIALRLAAKRAGKARMAAERMARAA